MWYMIHNRTEKYNKHHVLVLGLCTDGISSSDTVRDFVLMTKMCHFESF
jgi:hypothetical protein